MEKCGIGGIVIKKLEYKLSENRKLTLDNNLI